MKQLSAKVQSLDNQVGEGPFLPRFAQLQIPSRLIEIGPDAFTSLRVFRWSWLS